MRPLDSRNKDREASVTSNSEDLSLLDLECRHASDFADLSRWIAGYLTHRFIVDEPKRILSLDQLPLLIDPLITRIHAGILQQSESAFLTFVSGVICGGLPLDLFTKEPCIDLSLKASADFFEGVWLSPHLKEREVLLPTSEDDSPELTCQHHRIISHIQRSLEETDPSIPIFFLGSAASLHRKSINDIDIGTSAAIRRALSDPSDEIYKNHFDRFSFTLRRHMREGKPIIGRPEHVGAIWEYMPLALGISVARHGRAFRVTPSEVFIIEADDQWNS